MIIKKEKDELKTYLEDTSNIQGNASILYLPESEEEVISCVKACVDKGIPFTVAAGHTGTTGASIAQSGAIISLERLNRIIDIDKDKKIAIVEAGVTLEDIEKEVNKLNLTLRASPTESLAFIGGALATNASGVRGFGYGSVRNYVKSIDVVLPTAEVLRIKRGDTLANKREFNFKYEGKDFKFSLPSYNMPEVKSQAGYFVKDNMDLIDLFIGSEGTLGVITRCELILQSIPFGIFDGLVFFDDESQAYAFINKVKQLKKGGEFNPVSLEFFDANSLDMLRHEHDFIPKCEAAVYFEQEADSQKSFDNLLDKWVGLIEEHGASLDKSIIADTPKERQRVFDFRHSLPQMINEFLRQNHQVKVATDIAVPWKNFKKMYEFYKEKAIESEIDYVNFGHIGEGHLHFNFLPKNEEESIKAQKYLEEFCQMAVSLGGTVSAEHGIGKIKRKYLKFLYNEKEIKEMAHLKKYFDPQVLMGRDNIFDKELLSNL